MIIIIVSIVGSDAAGIHWATSLVAICHVQPLHLPGVHL